MDFNPQSYAPDGTAIFAKDTDLLVKFFRHAELSQIKSIKGGAPIYDDVDMIEVITPGEKDPVRVVATPLHQRRFPRQWEAYKNGQEMAQSGTPIEMLLTNQPSAVLQLKSLNIHTIQQLAGLSDSAKQMIPMGGQQLQDKAKAYLSAAHDGQNFHAMQAAMQAQIDQLKNMLTEQGVTPPAERPLNLPDEKPQPEAKRGPGRPRKDQAA